MANKKKNKRENFLILRYGGMGDNLFFTPVVRYLHDMGYDVDVATNDRGKPLLEHNQYVKNIYELKRFGPNTAHPDGKPVNLVSVDGIDLPDLALYRKYQCEDRPWRPFNVVNYFRVTEGCTLHPEVSKTQASDYVNAYDEHFGWAGIDPQTVPDALKRPVYFVTGKEREWAKKILSGLDTKPVAIQTQASSDARSISPMGPAKFLFSKGEHILLWQTNPQGGVWTLDGVEIPWHEEFPTIRQSAALLEQCKFAITSDTCFAHLAEALKVPHLTFYSTVPAWTRSKYYKYEITVDSNVEFKGQACKCCVISANCPRKEHEAFARLNKTEQELLATIPMNHPSRQQLKLPDFKLPETEDIISYFECVNEQSLNMRIDVAIRRFQDFLHERAYCVASLDLVKALEENYEKLSKGDF